MRRVALCGAVLLGLVLGASLAPAQETGDRHASRREEFRQRMMERIKTQLGASAEEWAVLQPLLEQVVAKQREAGMSMFRGGRDGRGRGPQGEGGQQGPDSGASLQSEALRKALETEGVTPEELKAKLAALRDAQQAKQLELKAARDALRQVLTLKQECQLVLMGLLD